MNNDHLLTFQRLDAYQVAKELAKRVHEARIRDSELRDQATRAAKSAFLGLCEGLPSDAAGIRRRHLSVATMFEGPRIEKTEGQAQKSRSSWSTSEAIA